MKAILFIILCNIYFSAAAQKTITPFGKIDKADLELKDCDFDKGAEAMVLIDEGNTYYDQGSNSNAAFKTVFERRTRIKILKEKGLSYANLHIPYYSHDNIETITNLKAVVYSLSAAGGVTAIAVEKKAFYQKKIDNYFSEIILAFPDVKQGSVIEYKYKIEIEDMGRLKDWYFQGSIPVRLSRYQLTIPEIFRFTANPMVTDKLEQSQKVISENIASNKKVVSTQSLRTVYTMHNLPGIKQEPFMSTTKDYTQRLEFQLSQIHNGYGNTTNLRLKWSDVVKDLNEDEDFGQQLAEELPATASFTEQAKQEPDTLKRMRFIYSFVQKNINWDGTENIYTRNGTANTWKKKSGNTADINLLLIKLLTDAGITAMPALFSTRNNGVVNINFPYLNQFNTVMAYVIVNNSFYVLDATNKFYSSNLTPPSVTNLRGFIVSGERGEWKTFFSGTHKYKNVTAIKAFIEENGTVHGDAYTSSFDYARSERLENWSKDPASFASNYFSAAGTAYKVENITATGIVTDSLPFEQKVTFSGSISKSGSYGYFTTNLFTGLGSNPFIAEERISDIEFGYNQEYLIFSSYSIPEGYAFEGLPDNISVIMADTSMVFTRSVQANDNLLNIRVSVDFRRPVYPAAVYPEVAAFYKKMFAKLNEQIVIKKKEN